VSVEPNVLPASNGALLSRVTDGCSERKFAKSVAGAVRV